MNRKFLIITGLLGLYTAQSAFAKDVTVYRWVDENNVVHYGQHQPLKDDYAEIKVESTYSPVQAPLKESVNKDNADIKTVSPAQKGNNNKIKCQNAKTNLRTLQKFEKIEFTDANGKSKILSNTEHLERLKLSEKEVAIYCK